MKKVLLLAFYFVPRNHIASYRSGCFAKFLPQNGWLPTVVCDDWPAGRSNFDPEFVGVIPEEVKIHRILNPQANGFYERFFLRKVAPYIWPQQAPLLWYKKARAKIMELLQTEKFDAIWATSDPLVPIALAAEVAELAGIPWVADIRDSFNVQRLGSWYKRPLFAYHERRLSAKADHVVAVSEGLAEGLGRRLGKKVTVIHNGFDPTLLPATPPERSRIFTIVYAGSLVLPHRNPNRLFQALDLCLQRKTIPWDDIEVQFYGSDPKLIEQCSPGVSQRLPVKVLPRISHKEILKVQMAASVLLLLSHETEKGVLTGKIFDYLAAGRPILAIPDDGGETSNLLKRTGAGIGVTDVEAIATQLAKWYAAWKSGDEGVRRDNSELAYYSRPAQAKRLAAILDDISARR